jgi:hypothetical protein
VEFSAQAEAVVVEVLSAHARKGKRVLARGPLLAGVGPDSSHRGLHDQTLSGFRR